MAADAVTPASIIALGLYIEPMNDSRSVETYFSSSKTPQAEDKTFSVVVIAPKDDRQSTPLLDSDSKDVDTEEKISLNKSKRRRWNWRSPILLVYSAMVCSTLYRSCLLHDSTVLPRAGDNIMHERERAKEFLSL